MTEYLIIHNTEILSKEIENKIIKSQLHHKKIQIQILPKSKILILTRYVRRTNNLSIIFGKTLKQLIPAIMEDAGSGNTYLISINFNINDLIKDTIYNVDYHLVKEILS